MIKIKKVIYTEKQIIDSISKAAENINRIYKGRELTLICLLKGSANFNYELSKRINIKHKIGYILAKSYYGESNSSGRTSILSDIDFNIENDDVIIVEDIIDSGRTLKAIHDHLLTKKPNSIKIYTLLNKKLERTVKIKIDYSCFEDTPDVFLIGFGLDYNEKYRNMKEIVEAEIEE